MAHNPSTSNKIKQKMDELQSIPADNTHPKKYYQKTVKKKQSIPDNMKQKISIAISDTLPLKQALVALSEQAKLVYSLIQAFKILLCFQHTIALLLILSMIFVNLLSFAIKWLKVVFELNMTPPTPTIIMFTF